MLVEAKKVNYFKKQKFQSFFLIMKMNDNNTYYEKKQEKKKAQNDKEGGKQKIKEYNESNKQILLE